MKQDTINSIAIVFLAIGNVLNSAAIRRVLRRPR